MGVERWSLRLRCGLKLIAPCIGSRLIALLYEGGRGWVFETVVGWEWRCAIVVLGFVNSQRVVIVANIKKLCTSFEMSQI